MSAALASPQQLRQAPRRKAAASEGVTAHDLPWRKFIRIPHAVIDLVRRGCLRGLVQRQLLDVIVWGMWDAPEPADDSYGGWARIPLDEFAKALGCSLNEASVSLVDAAERGIIERRGDGREALYRLRPDRWSEVQPYSAKKPAKPPKAKPDIPSADGISTQTLVVLPGAASPPLTLGHAVTRVLYRNESGAALAAEASDDAVGGLTITFRPPTATEAAENIPSADGISASAFVENKAVKSLEPLRLICERAAAYLERQPSAELLKEIATGLNGTPLARFESLLHQKLSRPSGNRAQHSPVFLLHLAVEAKARFENERMAKSRAGGASSPPKNREPEDDADLIRGLASEAAYDFRDFPVATLAELGPELVREAMIAAGRADHFDRVWADIQRRSSRT